MKNYLSGGCKNDNRPKNDFYQTPYHCTRLLLDQLQNSWHIHSKDITILEPCSGKGAITKVFDEYGLNFVSYDLFPANVDLISQDFLDETRVFDYIITNPPYNISNEFILKAKQIASRGFALLLPINYLQGKKRFKEIWSDKKYPLTNVFVFTRYLLMSEDIRQDGTCDSGMVVFAWFIWEQYTSLHDYPKLTFLDNDPFIKSEKRGQ